MLGRDLEALIQRAREYKKEYGDSFVSVEHLVLGFAEDRRFGRQLFKDFQISLNNLKSALQAIRGRQNVIDQGSFFVSSFIMIIIMICLIVYCWLSCFMFHKLLPMIFCLDLASVFISFCSCHGFLHSFFFSSIRCEVALFSVALGSLYMFCLWNSISASYTSFLHLLVSLTTLFKWYRIPHPKPSLLSFIMWNSNLLPY